MGNTDLRTLAHLEEVPVDELAGSAVAVDFHNWIYRYLTILVKFTDQSVYTTSNGQEVANLLGIIKGLPRFYENDLTPVFVFDGAVLELKEEELERREEQKEAAAAELEAAREIGDEVRAARLEARTQRLTPTILRTSRELLDLLGVATLEAPAEAEAQAAYMNQHRSVEYVVTEDYDALLFGAPYTIRKFTSKDRPELMGFAETLEDLDISHTDLVDAGILCGTDYNDGVHGIGPKTAIKLIKSGKTIEEILDDRDATIPKLQRIREIYLDPDVTDAYEFPTSGVPDYPAVEGYLRDEWEIPEGQFESALSSLKENYSNSN